MSLFDKSKAGALVAVTGSQRPYIFDLPHLLSLPVGFEFRFRYRHRWVSSSILSDVAKGEGNLVGRELVIVFHSTHTRRILPIRVATIIAIENVGPMIFVRLRAGRYFETDLNIANYSYSSSEDREAGEAELVRTAKRILGCEAEGFDLSKPLPDGWYLRDSSTAASPTDLDSGDSVAAWARMVAILHSEPSLRGVPFFYLMGFYTEQGKFVDPKPILNQFSLTKGVINGFKLKEGCRYRMRVAEWCEPAQAVDRQPVRIDCEFDASHFKLEGSSNIVVGRYDVIEFTFACAQPGYSEMALRAEPESRRQEAVGRDDGRDSFDVGSSIAIDAETPWDKWPTMFVARVPVVVRPAKRRAAIAVISLIIGLSLYLYAAPLIEESFGGKLGESLKALCELCALAVLYFGFARFIDGLDGLFNLGDRVRKLTGGSGE